MILVSGLLNLSAQPELQNEGSRVETLPGGGRVVEWYGKTGRSYFIQVSDPADHLRKWKWSDIIERGNNQSISYEVDSTADKAFFRLQYTDQTADDLENADFDGDGITNFAEITATALALGSSYFIQSNPLDADTDHDGLGDKFERDHGLDPSDDGSNDPAYGPNGDPDGDGLTNLEEQTRGTGPNKRDTDNDGVSDWDEIFLNQSDPIATMDTDNDGIPDDFEKWLSSQLLAFRPDPAHWGAFSTGLLTGNLNPTHDYTDENLTALQLSTQLNRLNESDSQNSAFKIERQERVTRLLGYSGQGPTPISGYFDILMPNGYFGTQITAASELDSANFLARSEASNWKQSSSPVLNSWQGFNQNYLTSYGESFFSTTTHGGNTQYSARLVQSRFQIQATRLDHEPITQQLLKVVTRAPIINNSWDSVNLEIVSVDKLSVNIPQGKFFSSWHEFQPPVTDGYSTMIDLLPVEFKNIRDVANTGDDVSITPKQNATDTNIDSVAWIDNHTSATEPAPRMPQLKLSINGLSTDIRIKAKLLVDFTRPYAGHQTQDLIRVPADGNFREVTGSAWDIYADPDWAAAVTAGFFGGDATLTYQLSKPDGTVVLQNQTILFRIAGQNPVDATCKAYIVSQSGTAWFAYALAKHESSLYGGEATYYPFQPVTPNNARYNQFRALGGGQSGARVAGREGIPLFERAEASGPGGIGMFQVTCSPTDQTTVIPRAQIWNWQGNVTGALAIIQHSIKSGLATRFYDDVKNDSALHLQRFNEDPPPSIVIGNTTFTSTEAIWLTSYNGWGGTVKSRYIFDPALAAGLSIAPAARTRRWHFNPPMNPDEFYIRKVERLLEANP